jgi:uncharacterized protein (TIGR02145 family)
MKKILTFSFTLLCWSTFAQTLQNINKNTGTVSNPINQIDSIRFDTVTNQMEVVLQSGIQTHALADVINVTITSNSCGSVTDIDGNVYQTVSIGTQCWMKENLKTSKYRDSSAINNVLSNNDWATTNAGAYCIYGNDTSNNTTYGKLYNWYAVADSRNLCPVGWHVPSDAEWKTLEIYLGMSASEVDLIGGRGAAQNVGGKLKSTSTLWTSPNIGATNESGFSGLPGGYREFNGPYSAIGSFWWSSTEFNPTLTWGRGLYYNYGYSYRDRGYKRGGFSVRCLRD